MSQCIKKDMKKDSSRTKTIKDEQIKSLNVFPSMRNMIKEEWYFNSRCSWHMMGNKHILTDLQPSSQDSVIFGDGAKGRVVGTGSLIILEMSKRKNVLLFEGLAMNLINVSQLCDEELLVQFTKNKYMVQNQNHCHIMEGERSSNNCYLLTNTTSYMNEMQQNQET